MCPGRIVREPSKGAGGRMIDQRGVHCQGKQEDTGGRVRRRGVPLRQSWGQRGGSKPERVILPGDRADQQLGPQRLFPGDLAALQEAGKGDGEGSSDNLTVPGAKRCGLLELLKEGSKEWEGIGQFGHCWSEAMGVFDAALWQISVRIVIVFPYMESAIEV
ncbi:uncharacterized protein UBRO_21068 [Ustilago bromivora]|uniref:Uncharacterized protein n=1 Tax=Ustilago bromivora TaxID=307758 RepID=A0A1K0G4R2_9BASI|nr:uncharacterized protein UBRO_21068 [Ustilago bromivora]